MSIAHLLFVLVSGGLMVYFFWFKRSTKVLAVNIKKVEDDKFYKKLYNRLLKGAIEYLQLEEEDDNISEGQLKFISPFVVLDGNFWQRKSTIYYMWYFTPRDKRKCYAFASLASEDTRLDTPKGRPIRATYNYGFADKLDPKDFIIKEYKRKRLVWQLAKR